MRGYGFKLPKRMKRVASQANKRQRCVIFEPGDWVWVHMRKERFPAYKTTKLHSRGDGPFQILEKINDNAYKVDLPDEYKVSATFNVSDFSPFDVGEDSWSNPFEERGNDGNQGGMMGTKVGLFLKILCKFQMGQLQDQEPRRSRKQCKDWCNPLGMKLARAQQSKRV